MSQANLMAPWAIFYSCTMTAEKTGRRKWCRFTSGLTIKI